jgi:phosphoribosyl 1,2-cyclic phosphodiesterase
MHIQLFGTRGSLPTPGPNHARYGGNTSCVGVSQDGSLPSIILDAGTGLATARSVFAGEPFVGSILLGHLHWDHIYGLPFFPPGDRPDARVDLYMPAQGDPIEILERPMSPPVFPIGPRGLRGDWSFHGIEPGRREIERFSVLAEEIPHKGGRSFGYRIDDGETSVAYLSDHSPISLGEGPDGIGAYHEAALRLADGVDLLIHDAQYTLDEFEQRRDWGHCAMEYPIELGKRAGSRRVLLFHHDPSHTDDVLDGIAAEITEPNVALAVEGTVIRL